ncbi:MAG TPA: alpha-amylase family glycosyl hydrolase [Gemmatimonadales bacterium]
MRNRPLAALFWLAFAAAPAATPVPAQAPANAMAPDTSWVTRSAIYQIFVRDFSPAGTFRGVIDGLDRVEAVGADVIWLMPIHPIGVSNRKGSLGSPYAVVDYYAVNPDMGTRADFRELVRAVHARGMKLIIDWVPNHTAHDAVWTTAHADFHVRDSAGRLTTPRDEKGNLTDWTDVAQLDYGKPALRQAMLSAMRYWLEEFGIDGFRVDVAGFVPDDFWREAVPALRRAVPRPILLLAEWGDPKMHRLGFDLTYGWDPYARLKEVWKGASASAFVQKEVAEMQAWPRGGMRLRFTTNHDETAWDQPPVTLFGGPAGARAAQVATALLPGRPMLYNGQEAESPLKLRLFEKDTIDWNAPGLPAARVFYRRVMELSRTLRAGDFAAVTTSAPGDVIAYRRGDAVVLVNPRPREVRFSVTGVAVDGTRDLLTDRTHAGTTVSLPAHGAMVLAPR